MAKWFNTAGPCKADIHMELKVWREGRPDPLKAGFASGEQPNTDSDALRPKVKVCGALRRLVGQ